MNITLSSSDICVRSGSIIAAEPKYLIFVMVLGHLTQHIECIVFCNVLVFYYSVLSFSSLLFSDVICISCFCVAVSLLFLVSPVCTFMCSTACHVPLSLPPRPSFLCFLCFVSVNCFPCSILSVSPPLSSQSLQFPWVFLPPGSQIKLCDLAFILVFPVLLWPSHILCAVCH